MTHKQTITTIIELQRKWNRSNYAANLFLGFAVSMLATSLLFLFTTHILLSSLFFICVFVLLLFYFSKQFITEKEVANYLNQHYSGLQESTHLLTKPSGELTLLESLQIKKISSHIEAEISLPASIQNKTKRNLLLLIFSFLFLLMAVFLSNFLGKKQRLSNLYPSSFNKPPAEKIPADIQSANIIISPPGYTHKPARRQSSFNVKAEEGAMITWEMVTAINVKDVQIILNNQTILHFKKDKSDTTHWTTLLKLTSPAFYELSLNGKKSEMYAIEMIPDAPPQIIVNAPKQSTILPAGQPKRIDILTSVTDDYGIDSVSIHATTASGSGEAVTFKQLALSFPRFQSGSRNASLEKRLDLGALGLTPGDELYFYISATDNHGAEKRSDVYAIRLEDTAQLMSLSGLATGLDTKPELFRSQRQIIIETEQLLKDKDTIIASRFNNRSDDIGTDQQMLRLRYGKYLGEETENEIDPTIGGAQTNDAADFGNKSKVIDQYSDKHDNAEDAGFFDAATKKQLQNMLGEMWKASLQLKTHHPTEALPFEYNALRLLKQLQQKERIYVAKTGVKTTPLNLDKRLTGELDKIIEPTTKETIHQQDSSITNLRKAMAVLEKLREGEMLQREEKQIIQNALPILSVKAAAQPSVYLASYQSLQKLSEGGKTTKDINIAGKGLQHLIQSLRPSVQSSFVKPDMGLSRYYYQNIKP